MASPAASARPTVQGELILVVDDDDEIRELICDYLESMGYRTRAAASGREMWPQLDEDVALVVLDLMLPGEDGLSLCRTLHNRSDVPVIMISARGAASERIIGLETGADDYLCKPFDPRELLARIRALHRRTRSATLPTEPTELRVADWRLDLRLRRLSGPKGTTINLSRSDFVVLQALAEAPNRIVSRDALSRRAFGRAYYINDRSIDVCISRLRSHLEDDARRPRLIRTVRNEGYLLECVPDRP